MKKSFYWIVGGIAAWYILSKTLLAKKANIIFKDVRPGGKLLKPEINIDLLVQNPTNTSATFKSLTGNLYLNDKFVANFTSFGDQIISPRAESVITITAKPGLVGAYNTISTLLKNRTGSLTAMFTGTANIDGFVIPVNETINI
jgi:hypothetical protein